MLKARPNGATLLPGDELIVEPRQRWEHARTDAEHVFRRMLENKAPGVAVMSSRVSGEMAVRLAERGVASVFLDSDGPGPRKSNIRLDYGQGCGEAVRYLHTLGHRRFALIAGPQTRASHAAYREALERELKKLGLKLRVVEAQNDPESGAAAATRLLGRRCLGLQQRAGCVDRASGDARWRSSVT